MYNDPEAPSDSVLGSLRAISPTHDHVSFREALHLAERQASRLLHLHRQTTAPTPTELITKLPKLTVEHTGHAASGATFWHRHHETWVIHLSHNDSWRRRRFTLAHEFKHIIDHGRHHLLYKGTDTTTAERQAERAADYFAGCLLVPRHLLERAWHNGARQTRHLAELFHVSEKAITVRLRQCGLVQPRQQSRRRMEELR